MIEHIISLPAYFQIGLCLTVLNVTCALLWLFVIFYRMYWRYVRSGDTYAPDPFYYDNGNPRDPGASQETIDTIYIDVKKYNPLLDKAIEDAMLVVVGCFMSLFSIAIFFGWPITLPVMLILVSARHKRQQQILINTLKGKS